MPEIQLYSICSAPMLGSPTDGTVIHESEQCTSCNMSPKRDIQYLEYEFDFWSGEAVVSVLQELVVSDDLKSVLEKSDMTGFEFREIYVEYSAPYQSGPGDPDLVDFWHLHVPNVATAGDGWWIKGGICAKCGRVIWKMTGKTTQAIFHAHEDDNLPRRSVIAADYTGMDILKLSDPGPIVVSKRMLDFLRSNGAVDLEVQPVDIVRA